jgi:hypothetical protein
VTCCGCFRLATATRVVLAVTGYVGRWADGYMFQTPVKRVCVCIYIFVQSAECPKSLESCEIA